jgi:2-hydroxychromene-2-carboxylate isomerase
VRPPLTDGEAGTMTDVLEFYFDFSSPYGYFASHRVDEVAEAGGRRAVWKPIMLGAVMKQSGVKPLIQVPIKGEYSRHDWERLGRLFGVPWVLPDPFPIATLAAARAFYWLDADDPDLARDFARSVFNAYFGEGRDITSAEVIADLAEPLGVDRDALLAAVQDPQWKQRLVDEGNRAIERGVCGSPFFIVDGEGFWGCDRLLMVQTWMTEGGW